MKKSFFFFYKFPTEGSGVQFRVQNIRLFLLTLGNCMFRYTMMKHRKEPANRMRMRILKYGPRRLVGYLNSSF